MPGSPTHNLSPRSPTQSYRSTPESVHSGKKKETCNKTKLSQKNAVKQGKKILEETFADLLILEIKYTAAGSGSL